jgi:hypothetical protein
MWGSLQGGATPSGFLKAAGIASGEVNEAARSKSLSSMVRRLFLAHANEGCIGIYDRIKLAMRCSYIRLDVPQAKTRSPAV